MGNVIALQARTKARDPLRQSRFRLQWIEDARQPVMRVVDPTVPDTLLEWTGETARHLRQLEELKAAWVHGQSLPCDKALISRLALAAAGFSIASIKQHATLLSEAATKLAKATHALTRVHLALATLLFRQASVHLSQDEVVCLLSLEQPAVSAAHVVTCLNDLVEWELLQRIDVSSELTFYDTNTTTHLHVYDHRTGLLTDAPQDGWLELH